MANETLPMRSSVEEGVDRRVAGEKSLGQPHERNPAGSDAQNLNPTNLTVNNEIILQRVVRKPRIVDTENELRWPT